MRTAISISKARRSKRLLEIMVFILDPFSGLRQNYFLSDFNGLVVIQQMAVGRIDLLPLPRVSVKSHRDLPQRVSRPDDVNLMTLGVKAPFLLIQTRQRMPLHK